MLYVGICLFNFSWPGSSRAGTTFSPLKLFPRLQGYLARVGDSLQSPVGKLTEEESHPPRSTKGAFECHRKGAGVVGLGGSAGLL